MRKYLRAKLAALLPLLLTSILLQSCLPDSFTKWNQEPAKKTTSSSSQGAVGDSGGVVPPPVGGFSTPPTSIQYSSPSIITDKSTAAKASTITKVTLSAIGGGEIKSGEMGFKISPALPDNLKMDALTGTITGTADKFSNNVVHTITGTHITGAQQQTTLQISVATVLEDIKYPQFLNKAGTLHTLCGGHYPNDVKIILKLDKVSGFKACDTITSSIGAFGIVTLVDSVNNLVYVDVHENSPSNLYFEANQDVDNEPYIPPPGVNGGFFFSEGKILEVTYSFKSTSAISGFNPVIFPNNLEVAESASLRFSLSPDVVNSGLTFSKSAGSFSGTATTPIPKTAFNVSVKNINNKSFTKAINLSVLPIDEPKVISEINYEVEPLNKMILRVGDVTGFNIGERVKQSGTTAEGRITLIEKDLGQNTGLIHLDIFPAANGNYIAFDNQLLNLKTKLDSTTAAISIPVISVAGDNSNRRRVLEVQNIANFTIGGYVSNKAGTIGIVKSILSTGNDLSATSGAGKLFVELIDGSVGRFKINDQLDRSKVFLIPYDIVTSDIDLAFKVSSPFSISPTAIPNMAQTEINDITWSISPLLPGPLCINASGAIIDQKSQPKCIAVVGSSWKSGPYCIGQTGSYLNHLDKTSCIATGTFGASCNLPERASLTDCINPGTWISGPFFDYSTGTIYALDAETPFPKQKFTVMAQNSSAIPISTDIYLSLNSGPKDLAYTRNILIKLTDGGSQFDVGDKISNNNGGVGVITKKTTNFSGTTDTYIVVRVLEGQFLLNEDIDNAPYYQNQKETISWISNISSVITYTPIGGALDFAEGDEISIGTCSGGTLPGSLSKYECEILGNGVFTVKAKALAMKVDTVLNEAYLRVVEGVFVPGTNPGFQTGKVIGRNRTDNFTATINQIFSDNNVVTVADNAGKFLAGMNFSQTNTSNVAGANDATGVINLVNSLDLYLTRSEGSGNLTPAYRLYRLNPPNSKNGTLGVQNYSTISKVSHDQSFYLYVGKNFRLEPNIVTGDGSSIFSVSPALPKGISLDKNTGVISRNSAETSPKSSPWKLYTITVSNPFGSSSHTLGLKFSEYFEVEDITEGKGNISGILHKGGKGFGRMPCIINQDQIALGAVLHDGGPASYVAHKDITCIYDVAEGDLYQNGLKLKVTAGPNVCEFKQHIPYWFNKYPLKETIPNYNTWFAARNIKYLGDYLDEKCIDAGARRGYEYPSDKSHAQMCTGNYYEEICGPSGCLTIPKAQCDEGKVTTAKRTFTLENVCYDDTKAVGGIATEDICLNQGERGVCTDGSKSDKVSCEDNDGVCVCDYKTDPGCNAVASNRTACSVTPGVGSRGQWEPTFAWTTTHVWNGVSCFQNKSDITDPGSCNDQVGTCAGYAGATLPTDRTACEKDAGTWTTHGKWLYSEICNKTALAFDVDYSCGGKRENCLAGAGTNIVSAAQLLNLTTITDRNTSPKEFDYGAPSSLGLKSNAHLANYVNTNVGPSCLLANSYEYDLNTWQVKPTAIELITDLSKGNNNPWAGGNPFYTFQCLDSAYNVVARIRILVREWDDKFKEKDSVDLMSPGALMDVAGNDSFGLPVNNHLDWKDYSGYCSGGNNLMTGLEKTAAECTAVAGTWNTTGGSCSAPAYRYPGSEL